MVPGSGFLVGTLSLQFLLQFKADPFETLHVILGRSEDMHVFVLNSEINFHYFFHIFILYF